MPLLGEAVSGELALLLVGTIRGLVLGSWCPTRSSSGAEGPAGARKPAAAGANSQTERSRLGRLGCRETMTRTRPVRLACDGIWRPWGSGVQSLVVPGPARGRSRGCGKKPRVLLGTLLGARGKSDLSRRGPWDFCVTSRCRWGRGPATRVHRPPSACPAPQNWPEVREEPQTHSGDWSGGLVGRWGRAPLLPAGVAPALLRSPGPRDEAGHG